MQSLARATLGSAALFLNVALAACAHDGPTPPPGVRPTSCSGLSLGATMSTTSAAAMSILGNGCDTVRYQAELAVRGNLAYTTSWGVRRAPGNKVSIWDVSGDFPVFIDSLIVSGATTTGDVAVSDDGSLLVVATERAGGSIVIYDLADPRKP